MIPATTTKLSKGQVEAQLCDAIIKFEKEHLGRGPTETRVFIVEDMLFIRLRGVLTPAEIKLAQTPEGFNLIRQVRRQLLEGSQSLLKRIVENATGVPVLSLHTDIDIKRGERLIAFTLSKNVEEKFGVR